MKCWYAILGLSLAIPINAAQITFDHRDGTIHCGDNVGAGACTMSAREGEALTILFLNSSPELLDRKVTLTEQNAGLRKKVLAIINGGSVTGVAGGTKGGVFPGTKTPPGSLQDSYDEAEKAVHELSDAVSTDDMTTFKAFKQHLHAAVTGLANAVGGFDSVADKLKSIQLQRPSSEITEWWRNVQVLDKISDAPSPLEPATAFVTDDLQIVIEFTSKNPLIKAPSPVKATIVQSNGWMLSNSTGFAASKLVDDHYSTRTITDKEAVGDTPAVTHREAVREDRDSAAAEATYFVHLRRVQPVFGTVPIGISFGVGLATGVKGRLYAGVSLPLGRSGALTFGMAAGSVKRLSQNVNTTNLGDQDPEATRRDVFHTAPFVGLSFRLE